MKNFASFLTAVAIASAISAEVSAASPLIIPDKLLDKTMASATQSQANRIHTLQEELIALQKEEQEWDVKILVQHSRNQEMQTSLGKQSKVIDADRLDQLEKEALQMKERYKPLLSRYTALNKQIEAARPLKSKGLNTLLRLQTAALKIPVQVARADIRAKEKAFQTAKEQASKAAKKLRGNLQEVSPINAQIKAKQSALKTNRRSLSPLWSAFKQSAKRADTAGVQSALSAMVTLLRQINEEKQRIYQLETSIGDKLAAIQL